MINRRSLSILSLSLTFVFAAGCSSTSAAKAGSGTGVGGDMGNGAPSATNVTSGVVAGAGGGADGSGGNAPSEFDLEGVQCPDFKGCAGSLVGTWDGEATCSRGLFGWFNDECADFTENSFGGKLALRYTFTETTMVRQMGGTLHENIDVSLSCTGALATCAEVAGDIVTALYGTYSNPRPDPKEWSAACTDKAAGMCNCDIDITLPHEVYDRTTGYELISSETFKPGDEGEMYEFCAAPSKLEIYAYLLPLGDIFQNDATFTLHKVD